MGGYVLAESGKREAALEFYRRALSFKVDLPIAWANVGKLLFEDQRYAEALDAFDATLGLRPKDADPWNSRAGALRKLGRLEEFRRGGAPGAEPQAALRRGGAQSRHGAAQARSRRRGARRLRGGKRGAAGLRRGAQRPGAGLARARPHRRSERRLRRGDPSRQPRGDRRQRLPRPDASAISPPAGRATRRAGSTARRSPMRSAPAFPSGAASAARASACW